MDDERIIIGKEDADETIIEDLINIDYLPKNKTPINNLFLVAPLFTPCSRRIDISKKYRTIEVKGQFGYSVKISGQRLNMSVDFPIWANIIKLISENKTNKIQMEYTDFAKILGYDRKSFGKKLINRISESLERLNSQSIIRENDERQEFLRLFLQAVIHKKRKMVEIIIDPNIVQIYKKDRFKLIDLEFYNELQNEITKALFLFYENHGKMVYPIKLDQIKLRLNLVTENEKEINRQIKQAHENLKEAKYISDFKYFNNFNNERCIQIKKEG